MDRDKKDKKDTGDTGDKRDRMDTKDRGDMDTGEKYTIEKYTKPDNISESRFEGDNPYIVIRNNITGEYFQLKEAESKVWDSIKNSTASEVRKTLLRKYDLDVDESSIEDLLYQLYECGILLKSEERKIVFNPQRKHIKGAEFVFGEINIEKLITRIYPHMKWIFDWKSAATLLGLCAVGLLYVGPEIATYYQAKLVKLGGDSLVMTMAYFLTLSYFPVAFIHEVFHGLACYHYNARVGKLGFSLLFFVLPCFYIRTTDAVMFDRKKRIIISVAGPFSTFVIMVLAAVFVKTLPPGSISYYAQNVYFLCNFALLFSLSPVLTNDGYYILADALDIPNFRSEAAQYLLSLLTFRKNEGDYPLKTRITMVLYNAFSGFWLFFIFTWVVMLGLGVYTEISTIVRYLQLGYPIKMEIITRLLVGILFTSMGGFAVAAKVYSGVKHLFNILKEYHMTIKSRTLGTQAQREDQ